MKFNIPTIISKLLNSTYDSLSGNDKRLELAHHCGYSNDFRINTLITQKDVLFPTACKLLEFFGYRLYASKDDNLYPLDSVEISISLIKQVLYDERITNVEFYKSLGITKPALYKIFKQPNLKVGTIVKMFNTLGYEVVAKSVDENLKSYIVGFDDMFDEEFAEKYEAYSAALSELSTTCYDFFDEFVKSRVDYDCKSKIRCADLYNGYRLFWQSCKNKHPTKTFDSFICLSEKEFAKRCSEKFLIVQHYVYGIKLKEI